MASKKEVLPPARPSAMLPGLGKLKTRQSSLSSDLTIRYSAASLDDDYGIGEEITIEKPTVPPTEEKKLDSATVAAACTPITSRSAPSSVAATPVSQTKLPAALLDLKGKKSESAGKVEGEKTSLFSGIKEKFHERFHEPLTVLKTKLEEKSGSDSSAEDARDRKVKKSDSADSPMSAERENTRSSSSDIDLSIKEEDNKSACETVKGKTVFKLGGSVEQLSGKDDPSSATSPFEIIDNFFEEEEPDDPFSEPSSSPKLEAFSVKSGSTSGSSTSRARATIQKIIGKQSKSPAVSKPVSLSLSGLLSTAKSDKELELATEACEEIDEFFDPAEDPVAQPATAESGTTQTVGSRPADLKDISKTEQKKLSWEKITAISVAIVAYLFIPLPSYLSGFITGASLATMGTILYFWLFQPAKSKQPMVLEPLESLPPLRVPEMKDSRVADGKFKGWMNELHTYNPDNFHLNQTHSVYVHLEGTTLRLQVPKNNVPKRAMFDEVLPNVSFIHQRYFDVKGSKVLLLPMGLIKKRIWSKKYPLCIALAKFGTENRMKPLSSQSENISAAPGSKMLDSSDSSPSAEKDVCHSGILYLFARTSREKEEWYNRFVAATKGTPLPTRLASLICISTKKKPSLTKRHSTSSLEMGKPHLRQSSLDSSVPPSTGNNNNREGNLTEPECLLQKYLCYMSRIMPAGSSSLLSGASLGKSSGGAAKIACEPELLWVNAVIGRFFWDFLREKYWAERMRDKIQRKLSKIHVPYFMDELTVTEIELGSEVPTIRRASRPYIDDQGLWVDFDIVYNGGFLMSLETKINLIKLKSANSQKHRPTTKKEKKSPVTDSEEEDSAESSTDDEGAEVNPAVVESDEGNTNQQASTSKKILRLVDKIAQSKYFQQATENKYIKNAMEHVSNTPLMLMVEMNSVQGSVAVNIPSPPTDRVWYGFRNNPRLTLSARPKVGEREVHWTHITDWIEKKLTIEFQRVFVMPNMDDIPIPLLCDPLETDNDDHDTV